MSTPDQQWLAAMGQKHYPFAAAYAPNPSFHLLFSDLYVVCSSEHTTIPDVTLDHFYSDGACVRLRLQVTTGSGVVNLIDTSTATPIGDDAWGAYRTLQWQENYVNSPGNNCVGPQAAAGSGLVKPVLLKIVISQSQLAALTQGGAVSYTAMNLALVQRNIDLQPLRVEQIIIRDTVHGGMDVALDKGSIFLHNGYNSALTAAAPPVSSPFYDTPAVRLDVASGIGLGRNPSLCGQSLVLRQINTVGGTTLGDFTLGTDNCYWLEKTSASSLRLHADCKACSDCSDYLLLYNRLVVLFEQFSNLNVRKINVLEAYKNYVCLVDKFKAELDATKFFVKSYQTGDQTFNIQVGLQAGAQTFTNVAFTWSFDPATNVTYIPYSGYQKLPNLVPTQTVLSSGVNLTYASGSPISNGTYSGWTWAVHLERTGVSGSSDDNAVISIPYTLTNSLGVTRTGTITGIVTLADTASS